MTIDQLYDEVLLLPVTDRLRLVEKVVHGITSSPSPQMPRQPHPDIAGKAQTLGDLVSPIVDETDEVAAESLPGARVVDEAVALDRTDVPAKPVLGSAAVSNGRRCPADPAHFRVQREILL